MSKSKRDSSLRFAPACRRQARNDVCGSYTNCSCTSSFSPTNPTSPNICFHREYLSILSEIDIGTILRVSPSMRFASVRLPRDAALDTGRTKKNDWREKWQQKRSARSRPRVPHRRTVTGGRTGWTCGFFTRTRRCRIRWVRSSTMRRNSTVST